MPQSLQDKVDTVVFDFGGVLIDWNPRYLYRKIFNGDEEAVGRFLGEVCTSAWNDAFDAGKPMDEGVAERIALFPEMADHIRAWRDRFDEMFSGPIARTVVLLEELHRRSLPLYGLTNWSAETFPYARKTFPFLERFRDVVVSGIERVAKPDPRIFEILIARSGCVPARTLFIDDNAANIAAANGLGFQTHRFETPEALARDLLARDLLARDLLARDLIAADGVL